MRAYYYACVSQMDVEIGKILDQLDASGQADNTLIVFTADHGEYLGDHWMFASADSTTRPPGCRSLSPGRACAPDPAATRWSV